MESSKPSVEFPNLSKIQHGDIVHMNLSNIPHGKFCVIINKEPLVYMYLINSSIHPFIMADQELLNHQILLKVSDYSNFLNYDSYLDCSRFYKTLNIIDFEQKLSSGNATVKGHLTTETKIEIIGIIESSTKYSPAEKHLIKQNLMKNS